MKAGNFAWMAVAGALGMVLAGCGQGRTVVVTEGQAANVITVNASAEVKTVPDKASFTVDVVTQGETPEEAQGLASEANDAVLAALDQAGVPEASIQTSYTNLSPVYDWLQEVSQVVGYEMRIELTVSEVAVSEVSDIMGACVAAGATGVNGPTYATSSYEEAYQQALAEAIASSRTKAEVMAKAAGVSLGEVVSVTEGYESTRYLSAMTEEAAYEMDTAADGGMAKVAPGEVAVGAQVTVTYAIG